MRESLHQDPRFGESDHQDPALAAIIALERERDEAVEAGIRYKSQLSIACDQNAELVAELDQVREQLRHVTTFTSPGGTHGTNVEQLKRAFHEAKQASVAACADAEKRLLQWKAALDFSKEENAALRAELEQRSGGGGELRRANDQLRVQQQQLEALSVFREQNLELERELKALRDSQCKVSANEMLVSSLEKQLEAVRGELDTVRGELEGARPVWQSQLSKLKQQNQELTGTVSSLKADLAAAASTSGSHSDKAARLEAVLVQESSHAEDLRAQKGALQDQVFALNEHARESEARFKALQDQYQQMLQQNQDLLSMQKQQLADYRTELAVQASTRDQREAELEQQALEYRKQAELAAAGQSEVLGPEAGLVAAQLRDTERQLRQKSEECEEQARTWEHAGGELEELLHAALHENMQLESQLAQQSSAGGSSRESKALESCMSELEELKGILGEAFQENMQLESQLAELSARNESELDNTAIVERVQRTEQWLEEMGQECQRKDKLLAEQAEEMEAREEHTERLQQEWYEQGVQLGRVQEQLHESEASRAEAGMEVDTLRHQLSFLQAQFAQREAELEDALVICAQLQQEKGARSLNGGAPKPVRHHSMPAPQPSDPEL